MVDLETRRAAAQARAELLSELAERLGSAMGRQAKAGALDGDLTRRFRAALDGGKKRGLTDDQAFGAALADMLIEQGREVCSLLERLALEALADATRYGPPPLRVPRPRAGVSGTKRRGK